MSSGVRLSRHRRNQRLRREGGESDVHQQEEPSSEFSFDEDEDEGATFRSVEALHRDTRANNANADAWVDRQSDVLPPYSPPIASNQHPRVAPHQYQYQTQLPLRFPASLYMNNNVDINSNANDETRPITDLRFFGPPRYQLPVQGDHDANSEGPHGIDTNLIRSINTRSTEDLILQRLSMQALRPRIQQSTTMIPQDFVSPSSSTISSPHKSIFTHDHKRTRRDLSMSVSRQLTTFLFERRGTGVQYDKSISNRGKSITRRKRTFREVIGNKEMDPFEDYHFAEVRPQPSMFFEPGASFSLDYIVKLNVLSSDFPHLNISGFFEFGDSSALLRWLRMHTNHKHDEWKNTDSDTIPFTAEIVDFENNDLRYATDFSNGFGPDKVVDYEHFIETSMFGESNSTLLTCFIWWQLSKWSRLPPFQGVEVNNIQHITTCVQCLRELQTKYVLLKLKMGDSKYPTMLGSVDRVTGEMSLVSTDDRFRSISLGVSAGYNPTNDPEMPLAKLNGQKEIYTLETVKFN
ncbi:CYFA0S22e01310g1_1 [Cyberlindnera fabianii]|uniref:CYFA0S22e01310g1_1 n=1 Tax=Cyberlindnera fabianii TaxID=36022 RepID=A0A061B8G5_CYBFA|nr:CYFA0S22e01310g1_1 [Cyberlindnera fabianii]